MRVNYTPEEIAEMHDRNENFNGTRANFSKIKLYQAVKSDLVEFMNMCDDVRMIDGYDPNMKEKHAILWLLPCRYSEQGRNSGSHGHHEQGRRHGDFCR